MNPKTVAREIGFILAVCNLAQVADSCDVQEKVGASMPLPAPGIADDVPKIVSWLTCFGKRKYMFLTPELALAEELLKQTDCKAEITFLNPCDLSSETKERIRNNLPRGGKVELLEEPHFPKSFYPSDGLIVICGYSAGNRAMVLPDTFRMVEHYSSFRGKMVFVPYVSLSSATRYEGWMEVNPQRISAKWEGYDYD